jgi:hypothetical protein
MSTMRPHKGNKTMPMCSCLKRGTQQRTIQTEEVASNNDDNDEVALEHGIAHGVLFFDDEFNTEDLGGEFDTDGA